MTKINNNFTRFVGWCIVYLFQYFVSNPSYNAPLIPKVIYPMARVGIVEPPNGKSRHNVNIGCIKTLGAFCNFVFDGKAMQDKFDIGDFKGANNCCNNDSIFEIVFR